ncbi:MAG TPA: hypothetical protein VKL19_02160 [Thermoanaerobaculia bacterium]|nr:hypothetical protein [Thermoanaerobaculia bacterium]
MRERVIAAEPEIVVYANDLGEIVLEQMDGEIHIPHEKIHQVTVWMRRIAAEFEGLRIPE